MKPLVTAAAVVSECWQIWSEQAFAVGRVTELNAPTPRRDQRQLFLVVYLKVIRRGKPLAMDMAGGDGFTRKWLMSQLYLWRRDCIVHEGQQSVPDNCLAVASLWERPIL